MKKRIQVLMLAALPVFGAFGLYALKQYQLPENVFRRETRDVTVVEIQHAFSGQSKTQLNGSDSAHFIQELHLEKHGKFDMLRGLSDAYYIQLFQHQRLLATLDYVYGYGLESNNGWWRGGYELTPSSKRKLNVILKKYGRQIH